MAHVIASSATPTPHRIVRVDLGLPVLVTENMALTLNSRTSHRPIGQRAERNVVVVVVCEVEVAISPRPNMALSRPRGPQTALSMESTGPVASNRFPLARRHDQMWLHSLLGLREEAAEEERPGHKRDPRSLLCNLACRLVCSRG